MNQLPRTFASDPTPGQVIGTLYCWVAEYADGTEGIIAGGIPGLGMTTLVTSSPQTAERMAELARTAVASAQREGIKIRSFRLVTFKRQGDA